MPRSARNKSSKHSSRDARDYSESEKDSSYKDKKMKEDSGVSIRPPKQSLSASGEKRKALDLKSSADNCKDLTGSENVECVEDVAPSLSKKRKEKIDDDRWIGGDNGEREVLRNEMNVKDSKGVGAAKSRSTRKEENLGLGVDGEGGKKSASKIESERHRSDRKERSEKGSSERERKVKDGSKSDKLGDVADDKGRKEVGSAEERGTKHVAGNTESSLPDGMRTPHLERDTQRRVRTKKDVSADVDNHQDCGRECKDKYKEVLDKDSKHHDEKPRDRDGRNARDYSHSRSIDKHSRADKDIYLQQKKSRPRDGDHDYGNDRGRHSRDYHDRDDHDADRDRNKERDYDHERDHSYERGRGIDRERDRNYRDRARERVRDRDRDFMQDCGRDLDHDHDRDQNSHAEDRGSRYKEDRLRRRSTDDYDDYLNDKSRSEKVESKADRNRSMSHRPQVDTMTSSSRGRSSPRTHGVDKYRDHDDFRHGDSIGDRAGNSETHDMLSKYRFADKRAKFEDNRLGDLSAERSPNTKASAMGLRERSPSYTSMDRKYANMSRSGRRRSLDVDEADRRSSGSNDLKDGSLNEERLNRDLTLQKPFAEEHHQAESSFHQRSRQGPGGPGFRAGVDGPSMGEDSRVHPSRYRRSVEPNVGRPHPWKGIPNWPSPLSNGFMPFPPGPHGPPHGSFPPILPQFPSPPIFGARPSLEMNRSGIPFMSDADRFSGHIRPLGWQNMVEGSGPSHFPVWDTNNGGFRDNSSMYGAGYQANGQLRDANADMWKNSDVSLGEVSAQHKDDPLMKSPVEEASGAQGLQGSRNGSNFGEAVNRTSKTNTSSSCLNKEIPIEKTPESSSTDDTAKALRVYLSKLDISFELTEPDLYDQCMNLVGEEQDDIVRDEVMEHVHLEESPLMTSEVSNSNLDITIFPAAEESIFERALDLYKTHCTDRRSLSVAPLVPEEHHIDTVSDVKGGFDGIVHTGDQEIQEELVPASGVDPALLPDAEPEPEELCSFADEEGQKDIPLESPESVLKSPLIEHADGEITNLVDEADDAVSERLSPKGVVDGGDLSLEITPAEVTGSKAIDAEMNVANESEGSASSSMKGQDDADAVNDPLVLADGSVKVCETSMSVSHESESVIFSRIHHAPESTH